MFRMVNFDMTRRFNPVIWLVTGRAVGAPLRQPTDWFAFPHISGDVLLPRLPCKEDQVLLKASR